MNTNCLFTILWLCVGLQTLPQAAFAVTTGPACFQSLDDGDEDSDESMPSSFLDPDPTSMFMAPSRELVRPLIRAIRLHNEGDDNDAAELIGAFLADSGDEDFLVLADKARGTAVSIDKAATEMLGNLPKSAIKSYRVRFSVPARQRLSLAVAESNYFEISQVMRRFPYTDAGIEAAMLMGHHHFDAGRALLAGESFQTALDLSQFSGKLNPQLSVLTAVSWALARRPDLAEKVMTDLAKANGGKFRLGDKEVLIKDEDPLAAIKTFVGSGPMDSTSTVDQWLLVGGNSRRTVTTADGFPVGQPIWQVDLADSQATERRIESAREFIISDLALSSSAKASLVPANVPLIVDGLLLVGNENQVSAVDFTSGKRVWTVAVGNDGEREDGEDLQFRAFQGRPQLVKTSNREPWTDFLQGHSSSDGKSIFHVVKTQAAPVEDEVNNFGFNNRIRKVETTNTLQAIDVFSEGELTWEVGGGQTTGDPRLAQVSFLGAPLPIDGVLYAIGRRLQEIVLVALNSKDGKLVWMQSLASSEDTSNSRYRRIIDSSKSHSLTPSYSKGILVCPTGKNALVAVDTIGRRVLWGAQATGNGSSTARGSVNSLKTLQNPQVFIENSRVVAFDVSDDPRILAVSLLDGSPLMKIGKAGVKVQEVLHVASVDEDRVVLVEKNRVRAISSDSGRKLWLTSIRKFGPPTGRGYVSEKFLYLPTEGSVIIKIDLESGEIVDGSKTDRPLGNLILHEGRVISRRETSVSCFEVDSKVIAEVDAAAKASGGIEGVSPKLKVKQAALLRNRGEARQAIELLQTINENDRSGRFKTEFLQSATLLFKSDPEYALTLFKKYENWFQFETDPQMFLGYVELLVKYGMGNDVVQQLFKDDSFFNQDEPDANAGLMQRPITNYNKVIPDDDEDQESESGRDSEKKDDDDSDGVTADKKVQKVGRASSFLENQEEFDKRLISFDQNQWAKAQLIRITRESPKSIPQIQAAIAKRVASADVLGVLSRHRFLRQFPLELVNAKLRFELAEQLIAEGHVAEAENLLASLLGFLPATAQQIESAKIPVAELSNDALVKLWTKIRDGQYGSQSKLDNSKIAQASSQLDFNFVNLNTTQVPYERTYPTVIQPRGETANRLFNGKKLSIWGGEQDFEVFSATGESETRFKMFKEGEGASFRLKNGSGWIRTNHSLAILRHGNLLLALDLSKLQYGQSAVIWEMNLAPGRRSEIKDELDLVVSPSLPPEDVTASFPTSGCCCFIEKDKLMCVNAFTGATLWTRTKEENHWHVLADESRVMTMDTRLNERSVFDVRTGERLTTQSGSNPMEKLWEVDGLSFTAVGSLKQRDLEKLTGFEDFRPEEPSEAEAESVKDPQEIEEPKREIEVAKQKNRSVLKSSKADRFLARYDVNEGDFAWKKVFDGDTKICRLSGDRFAALTRANQLYIFDSKSGTELTKIPSGLTKEQRQKVNFIGGFEYQGSDLIAMASTHRVSFRANGYSFQASRSYDTFLYGHLMLLSKENLKPVWDQLVEIAGFQLQPMLPSASPILIFNRKVQSMGRTRKQEKPPIGMRVIADYPYQLLALDMSNGHVVLNEVVKSISTIRTFSSPIVDLSAGKIKMQLGVHEVELTLKTSADQPPTPIASVTKTNPIPHAFGIREESAQVAAKSKFDIERVNDRLMQQAEAYENSLEAKRKEERDWVEKETSQ